MVSDDDKCFEKRFRDYSIESGKDGELIKFDEVIK